MCPDRHNEDFVQIDVSPDEDAVSSSAPYIAPHLRGDESSDTQIQDRLPIDEVTNQNEEDDDDELDPDFTDETIVERLIGLTEMFPDWFRDAVSSAVSKSVNAAKKTYSFSRCAAWFLASTATVCLLPVMLEVERAQMEEQEATEHRSMMLGPGGVGSTTGVAGFQANLPILSPVSGN
nr:mitochondrial import receptor subunit tom22 [Hymenolepis microstoma]